MPDLPLSPTAQHWIILVLVWVGFGTLVGLLATVLFPLRRPAGAFWAIVLGIVGSTVGLLALSWLYPGRSINPLSPVGFLAAILGTLALLVFCRLGTKMFGKPENDADNE
jgi:uncharacterized membrane protein YeaQ/YmgE (transglycosylase-associated protein family)